MKSAVSIFLEVYPCLYTALKWSSFSVRLWQINACKTFFVNNVLAPKLLVCGAPRRAFLHVDFFRQRLQIGVVHAQTHVRVLEFAHWFNVIQHVRTADNRGSGMCFVIRAYFALNHARHLQPVARSQ